MPSVLSTLDIVSAFCSPASFERKDKVENSVAPPVLREDSVLGQFAKWKELRAREPKPGFTVTLGKACPFSGPQFPRL